MTKSANNFLVHGIMILLAGWAAAALAQTADSPAAAQTRPTWSAYPNSPRRDLLSQAGDNRFWIARFPKAIDGIPGEEDTQLMYHEPFSPEWTMARLIPLRAIALAAQNDELFVAFDNGQLMITDGQDLRLGTSPSDGGKIIALANDGGMLWSLIDVSASATTVPSAASSQPSTQLAATQPSSRPGLYLERLDSGQWIQISRIPMEGQIRADQVSLIVNKGHALMAWQNSPRSIALGSWVTNSKTDWTNSGAAALGQDIATFKLLSPDNHPPKLWVAGEPISIATQPTNTSPSNSTETSSTQPAALSQAGKIFSGTSFSLVAPVPISGSPPPAGSAQTAELAQGRLRWLADYDGKLYEQADDLIGHTSEEMKPIANPGQQQIPLAPCAEAAAGMVVLSALAAFMQRKDDAAKTQIVVSKKTSDGSLKLPLAQPGARFAAALVDLVPLVAAIGAWRQANMDNPGNVDGYSVRNILILAGITYLAHTLISELICGQTMGKMLFGTRVVSTSGTKAQAWSIVVRNLFRTADFAVLPLLTVLLTPLHQRLGDILGNTTVIAVEETEKESTD